jgi:uncharacterized membrane-anchored protein
LTFVQTQSSGPKGNTRAVVDFHVPPANELNGRYSGCVDVQASEPQFFKTFLFIRFAPGKTHSCLFVLPQAKHILVYSFCPRQNTFLFIRFAPGKTHSCLFVLPQAKQNLLASLALLSYVDLHMTRKTLLAIALIAVFPLHAQEVEPDAQGENAQLKKFMDSLNFQTGDVKIGAAKAIIHANNDYQMLGAKDARRVLEELWGNPPDAETLGMIVPKKAGLLGDGSWAVVLSYSGDGYVSDKEANDINYDDMLKTMQQETLDSNIERKKAGYGSIVLNNWATRPHYDATSSKLYWAKDLTFDDGKDHTLNYDVRALGRYGYLSMNAVATMADLKAVETGMADVIKMAEFESGARYADFNASSDKTAAYGLAALVAGGLAAKTGMLAKLLAIIIAGKKVLFLVVAGAFAGLKKFFGGKGTGNKSGPGTGSNGPGTPPPFR